MRALIVGAVTVAVFWAAEKLVEHLERRNHYIRIRRTAPWQAGFKACQPQESRTSRYG